jgi:Ubiquitin-like modifier-activating enzyme ATG7 N-terminus
LDLIDNNPEEVLRDPAALCPFHVLSYANLKKYVFDYHVSLPALPSKWKILKSNEADETLVEAVENYIAIAPPAQRGFFIAKRSTENKWAVYPLSQLPSHPDAVSRSVHTDLTFVVDPGLLESIIEFRFPRTATSKFSYFLIASFQDSPPRLYKANYFLSTQTKISIVESGS